MVDYGGLFHDDVLAGHEFAAHDHRSSAPTVGEAGRERMERMRPIAERHGLSMLQLACAWNLAHPAVALRGAHADPGERAPDAAPDRGQARGARRAAARSRLSAEDSRRSREIGDNSGCMALKGASPGGLRGNPAADRWELGDELSEIATRWEIDPERDLRGPAPATANSG